MDEFDEVMEEVEEKVTHLEKLGFGNDVANSAVRVIDELYAEGLLAYGSVVQLFQFGMEGKLNDLTRRLAGKSRLNDQERDFAGEDRKGFEKMLALPPNMTSLYTTQVP